MPWQLEAMKDVGACDKARLAGKQAFDPRISEWGNPPDLSGILHWIHRCKRQTRGTETSKYPEEKKSTEIPLVAASERGPAEQSALVEHSGKCGDRGW